MGLIDRPVVRRVLEAAQEFTGVTVAPVAEVAALRSVREEFQEFASDAEELALHSLDYFTGRPHEMRPEKRRRLAQRSRIALMQDPLAGAEAELLASFTFGKGVSKPTARNPKVQDVIDEAWSDPINDQVFCGYQAQRKLSNELLTSAELFISLYVRGGRVRVGRRSADRIIDVIADPENENVPLYFLEERPQQKAVWNAQTDQWDFKSTLTGGKPKIVYWPHWRNLADAVSDREKFPVEDDESELPDVPPEKLAHGTLYHIAINQTGDQLRGNPPWARSLRFMSAMNVLTEAHVTMAQAASTFIARRAMKGTPRQITKAAANVLSAAGELGSAAFRPAAGWGAGGNAEPPTQPFTPPGTPGPFPPGSWWNENVDSSKLEALNLNSGASQMRETAQIVRAPIAATSQFGQHYLGDASDANLATASTLELPATMRIGGWQEYFEQGYRWFTDRAIEAAVKAGRLGGAEGFDGEKPLAEMRLAEAEDRAAMEQRTGKDLSYEFAMPFPGRRALADVIAVVQEASQTMDPNGVNIALRRILLRFLFEQIGIDDVSRAVEECIPEKGLPGGIGPQSTAGGFGGAGGPGAGAGAAPGRTGSAQGAGANDPSGDGQQPYGARSGTAAGGGSAGEDGALEQEWLSPEARHAVEAAQGSASKLFAELVGNPAVMTALSIGNGKH